MRFDVGPLAWGFAATTIASLLLGLAVARGLCDPFDRAVMERLPGGLAGRPGRPPTRFDTMMRDISSLGSDTVRAIFLIGCAGGLLATGNLQAAIPFVAITLGARIYVLILKRLISRERPPASGHAVPTYTTSFPSGHTLMATVMLLSAAALLTEGEAGGVQAYSLAFAAVLSFAIGIARMYLRVHWPSDILAGWLAGGAWVTGLLLLLVELGP